MSDLLAIRWWPESDCLRTRKLALVALLSITSRVIEALVLSTPCIPLASLVHSAKWRESREKSGSWTKV